MVMSPAYDLGGHMKRNQRRYVLPKTPELETEVDAVMRGFGFVSYAEMLRVLIHDAYRHLQRDAYPPSLTRHDIKPV